MPAGGGGAPEIVTEVDTAAGGVRHLFLDVLPGGEGAVYTAYSGVAGTIQAVDLETGEVKDLTPGTHPRYSTGYLMFEDPALTLWAAPFAVERLEFTGAPVALADGLLPLAGTSTGAFAVSRTGRLVYRTGALEFRKGAFRSLPPHIP